MPGVHRRQGPIILTIALVMRRASGIAAKAINEASGQATANAFIQWNAKSDRKPRFIAVITPVISNAMKNAMATGKTKRALPSMTFTPDRPALRLAEPRERLQVGERVGGG